MVRKVFFSFHYDDVTRVNVIRNSDRFRRKHEVAGFYDLSVWEEFKRTDPSALKIFINDALRGTSVTCVLIGQGTWDRPWVRYEILASLARGNGLIGVNINGVGFSPHDRSRENQSTYDMFYNALTEPNANSESCFDDSFVRAFGGPPQAKSDSSTGGFIANDLFGRVPLKDAMLDNWQWCLPGQVRYPNAAMTSKLTADYRSQPCGTLGNFGPLESRRTGLFGLADILAPASETGPISERKNPNHVSTQDVAPGRNPFEYCGLKVDQTANKVSFYQKKEARWVPYRRVATVPLSTLKWLRDFTGGYELCDLFNVYDWRRDNGNKFFVDWVEEAARRVGR